jgi:hypothetical protein
MKLNTYQIVANLIRLVFNFDSQVLVRKYIKLFNKYKKAHGTLHAIKHIKEMTLIITRYISGKPMKVSKLKIGITKDGLPKRLDFLHPLIKTLKPTMLRIVFTILNIRRSIVPDKDENIDYDTKSITDPHSGLSLTINPLFVKRFVSDFDLKLSLPPFSKDQLYISTKSGPNGPATLTITETIKYFNNFNFAGLSGITNSDGIQFLYTTWILFRDKIAKWQKSRDPSSIRGQETTRRLAIIKDPDCKMRIVGICDYLTQVFLQPLSDELFKKLKTIKQDRTYTQSPLFEIQDSDNKELNSYHSIDLSSATDRFPIATQKQLLTEMVNKEFAEAWGITMVGRSYTGPKLEQLYYAVGQPMGAKSSWPMFTLAHHMLLQWSASKSGHYPFQDYIMLGDDIVIHNDAVAKQYILDLRWLGVDISEQKTHVSKDTYEFAKRWFFKDKEITGLPIKGIVNNFGNPRVIYTILFDFFIVKENVYISQYNLSDLIAKLYQSTKIEYWDKKAKKLNSKPRVSRSTTLSLIEPISFLNRLRFKTITLDEIRSILAKWSYKSDYLLPPNKIILSEIERVLTIGVEGMLWNQVNQVNNIFKDINKVNHYEDEKLLKDVPIFLAFKRKVTELSILMSKLNWVQTIDNLMETMLMIDIEKISEFDREKLTVYKSIELSVKTRKLIRKYSDYTIHQVGISRNFRSIALEGLVGKLNSVGVAPIVRVPYQELIITCFKVRNFVRA